MAGYQFGIGDLRYATMRSTEKTFVQSIASPFYALGLLGNLLSLRPQGGWHEVPRIVMAVSAFRPCKPRQR